MLKKPLKRSIVFVSLVCAAATAQAQTLNDAIRLSENEAYESAEKEFAKVISAEPTNADAYYYQGQNFLKEEKMEEAKASFDKGISVNASSALNLTGLARYYWLKEDAAKSDENFAKAKTIIADKAVKKSDKTKVLCEMAETYIYSPKKDLAKADALLAEAEKLDATNTDVYLLEGDVFLEKDPSNGTPAIAKYKKALELNPKLAKAIIRQGKLYRRAGNPTLGLEKYKEAEAIDSTFAPAYREKAELYFLAGKKALAISNYQKYLQLNNNVSARQRYAYFLFDSKQYAEAIPILKELQSASTWKYTNRLLGYSLIETGDYANGLAALTTFMANAGDIKILPTDYKYLGIGNAKTGNDSIGIMYLNKALELDSTYTDLYSDMASAFMKQKKYAEAIATYKRKLSAGKDLSATEYMNMGNAYMQLKDFISADSSYVKVVEKSPNYANAYLNRGKANAAQDPESKTWAGKPFFEMYLTKVDFTDAKAKNGIMLAYEYLGAEAWKGVKNNEKATEYYTKLKELDPENAAAKAFFTKAPGK